MTCDMDIEEIPLQNLSGAPRIRVEALLHHEHSKEHHEHLQDRQVDSRTNTPQKRQSHRNQSSTDGKYSEDISSDEYVVESNSQSSVKSRNVQYRKRRTRSQNTNLSRARLRHSFNGESQNKQETPEKDIHKVSVSRSSEPSHDSTSTHGERDQSERNIRKKHYKSKVVQDTSQEDIYSNVSEELTQKRRRPVPLPRIKMNVDENKPKAAIRQVLSAEKELIQAEDLIQPVSSAEPEVIAKPKGNTRDEILVDNKRELIEEHSKVSQIKETRELPGTKKKSGVTRRTERKSFPKGKDLPPEPELSTLTYEKIIGIFIHRSDYLQSNVLIQHPVVKVHLIDVLTGEYLKKSDTERSVSFYYENENLDYILPLMTQKFDFRGRSSSLPCWEELLIFNDDFNYILRDRPSVVIMFEIMDFVESSVASNQYKKLGSEGGWHKIAWAFLKPVGGNGHLNVENKVRLQLYKPSQVKKSDCESCDVYQWWSGGIWKRYPGTLYVTIKGIVPPCDLPPVLRSKMALQQELTSTEFLVEDEVNRGREKERESNTSDNETVNFDSKFYGSSVVSHTTWSRLPAQSCKIPNQQILSLPTGPKGCLALKFSNSGQLLACGMATDDVHSIVLFTVPEGKEYIQFFGHLGLLYELNWSASDTMLLSASADCTACIWDVENKRTNFLQMLPHPSFVYCAQFCPSKSWVLATGCFDHIIRLWNQSRREAEYELVQELDGHTGFVGTLCFDRFGTLVSGDSTGLILMWNNNGKKNAKEHFVPWTQKRNIVLREMKDVVVNKLILHPGGQRLLVHGRDSVLRMVDMATASPIQWFKGALNHRVQTSACISPCGGLVLSASEDGSVWVWNADIGDPLAVYAGLHFPNGVNAIDYHPYEHMVAISSHGNASQIAVCIYNKFASGTDIGLHLFQEIGESDIKTHTSNIRSSAGTSKYFDNVSRSELSLKALLKEMYHKTPELNRKDLPHDASASYMTDDLLVSDKEVEEHLSWNNDSLLTSTQMVASKIHDEHEEQFVHLARIINKMDEVLSVSSSKSVTVLTDASSTLPADCVSSRSSGKINVQ